MIDRKLKIIQTEDGSHSLFLPELNETYHSFHGAVQESRHVFIQHGLHYFYTANKPEEVRVLEVGLGTGLNALLVAEWSKQQRAKVKMQSLEAYPIEEAVALSLNYPDFVQGMGKEWFRNIHVSDWGEDVAVHSLFSLIKVAQKIENTQLDQGFMVVFFDAFAPNKQAEMWEVPILEKIYHCLVRGGVLVTYCAKGQLKRDLKAIGFKVETLPGPPGKKEMVRAVKIMPST